jgi:hypothetical protein
MKKMLIFITLLMIYQEDSGGSPLSYRRYQQVMIPPYHPTESIQATFQFANTFADDITLTWRISNQKFYQTLIYTQSFSPRSLIQRSCELYSNVGGQYKQLTHRWHFPSGATIEFAHLSSDKTVYDYQSAQYAYIGFDESTHFNEL